MNRLCSFLEIVLISMALSACTPFSQIQNSVSRFDQATHTAANAETAFIDAVLTVDCEAQFYEEAFNYAAKKQNNFNLRGYCTPKILTIEQSETRKSLMNAIVLYADKMQALATSDDNKQLDTNSQTLAQNLNKLATTGGIKLKDPALVQGVETAFVTIAKMALDRIKYKNIQEAAQKMQPQLIIVVEALKKENWAFGQAMGTQTGKIGGIEIQLKALITESNKEKSDVTETFFNIVNGRNILLNLNQVPKQSFGLPGTVPKDPAKALNDALDGIINCNGAIAETKSGGIYAAANDLEQRATAALNLYKTIASAK
jgi:hypothetical protein